MAKYYTYTDENNGLVHYYSVSVYGFVHVCITTNLVHVISKQDFEKIKDSISIIEIPVLVFQNNYNFVQNKISKSIDFY